MSVCGGWSLVKHNPVGTTAITLWCRSWTCADCAPFRIAALKREAQDGNATTFITLTVNPQHGQSPEQRARELSNAWRLVVKRARRKFTKEPLEFLAVFEATKKGEPHLHIIARAPYIPQRWLSDQMNELIEAPIVDIRKIHSRKNVAQYVAKYVGKGPKPFAALKRYWSSPGFNRELREARKLARAIDSGWRIWKCSLHELIEVFQVQQRRGEWCSENEYFWPNGPPGRWDEPPPESAHRA